MAVHFSAHEVKVGLKHRTKLKEFIQELFTKEEQGLSNLRYVFCTDDYLLQINEEFLKHDTYTDIVTFELSDDPEVTEGEIYISIDRVKENAEKYEVTENYELHRVIFHGALHLCGYKDKSKKEEELMRKKEDEYLKLYFQD
ncbi:rRNA maturation RNase YbeY [Chitinophaga sp. GCM10012297]|uniref:Endoribonuclease YbeY n=1 Tax=Chitinophaga chungangae TaxID=2821488 RepID=A0ABS3YDU8_9BACT|nr:rRNA maturation RNase YbeY [Chitinophaga chungangae]MBO9152861.1 rRNA maturation RNase YbeY [Chitinophaga chungangae]